MTEDYRNKSPGQLRSKVRALRTKVEELEQEAGQVEEELAKRPARWPRMCEVVINAPEIGKLLSAFGVSHCDFAKGCDATKRLQLASQELKLVFAIWERAGDFELVSVAHGGTVLFSRNLVANRSQRLNAIHSAKSGNSVSAKQSANACALCGKPLSE